MNEDFFDELDLLGILSSKDGIRPVDRTDRRLSPFIPG
jgi:hypothetical protein